MRQATALRLPPCPKEHEAEVQAALSGLEEKGLFPLRCGGLAKAAKPCSIRVEAKLGPVTTFISNAGIGSPVRGDMLDVKPENFDQVMGVNVRGAFFLAQAVAQRMLQESGHAPYQSAIHHLCQCGDSLARRSEYCLSKAAAAMMARLYAVRLAGQALGL